jgi:regulation of enolase protein 1 (concanavalin A-like superfamily)
MVVCLHVSVGLAHGQSIPAPWSNGDVGAPALSGSAAYSSGVLNVDAAGADIWSASDQFHFVYQAVSGDVDIRARVDSLTFADEWSKAGVMIRSSLSASAAHGYALVSAGRGVAFQRRQTTGGRSTHTAGLFTQAPFWVRLVRSGTTITAFSSADGEHWTEIGSDTIALDATAYVGIAITSHNPGVRTTATLSRIALTNASVPVPTPTTPPPSGESSADIDNPPISGTTELASGTYTITASGAGVAGTADQFRYVYRPVSGNVEVIAKVESIAGTNPWAIAGVMIRESLAPGSRHAFAVATSREGYSFRHRFETGSEAEQSVISRSPLPGWVRLVRTGSLFEAFRSADGANWTKLGSATINIVDTAYVGIAVASVAGTTATAVVSGLTIRQADVPAEPLPTDEPATNPPANLPPAVILSSPTNGATFVAPASVTMSASANDPDGTISGVEFYANSTLLGRDATPPYSFSAGSLAAGMYALKAVATDDDGAVTISEAITITVTTATASTAPRWVVFQASEDHESLVSRYVLEIYAASGVPGVSAPLAVSDLGKPSPSSTGEIMVDRSAFFEPLAPGSYLAAVTAVGVTASARSEPILFSR